jgi:glycosyltransferase involved in cell wall biosynthesis
MIIGPVPPPYHGNSIPIMYLLEEMQPKFDLVVFNTSHNSVSRGNFFLRTFKVLWILGQIFRYRRSVDKVYLSMAESFFGNLRDIIIFQIFSRRPNIIVAQLFGGGQLRKILGNQYPRLKRLNYYYFRTARHFVVEGEMQAKLFEDCVGSKKVSIIRNFAPDQLFLEEARIREKFLNPQKINIIYVSNFLKGKGYWELINAYKMLSPKYKRWLNLEFAGCIVDDSEFVKNFFYQNPEVKFHGFLKLEEKAKLFKNAHIFCLPTYYKNEGQPFSIVEAYAAGCAVITTLHSGIPSIFTEKFNGYSVVPKDVLDLHNVIVQMIENRIQLVDFALNNSRYAAQHRKSEYYNHLIKIVAGE